MSEVHKAAERLEPLFDGSPHVDWDNANRDVIADLVTLARDWFERRDSNRQLIRETIEAFWNTPFVSSPLLPCTTITTFREPPADPETTEIKFREFL